MSYEYPNNNNNFGGSAGGGNAQNNFNRSFQITTSMLTLFDEDRVRLRVNGMENAIGINITIPKLDNPNGKTTYPKENIRQLLLTPERVGALYSKIVRDVLPAHSEKRSRATGVFTNNLREAMLEIRTDNGELSMVYSSDIDMDRKPHNVIAFKFGKTPVIDDYNASTGDFLLETVDAQFFMFLETLKGFSLLGGNNMAGHSVRVANQYVTNKVFAYLEAFAAKMNVVLPETNFYANNRGQRTSNSGFAADGGVSSGDHTSGGNVPMTEIDDPSQLL